MKMAEVYKSVELVGASEKSFDEAVRIAVKRAGNSLRNLQWLEVMDQRAYIKGGDVQQFQVTVRVWFELED
jgi:dodecin